MFAALCDDDKYIIEELKKLLLTYAKENRIIIDIDEFESGEKLLNSENNYDIIVLDFQLGSTYGRTDCCKGAQKTQCAFLHNFSDILSPLYD